MTLEKKLKFAVFGTGFWSTFQIAGWRELPGVECAALYNRTRDKATAIARQFGIADERTSNGDALLLSAR